MCEHRQHTVTNQLDSLCDNEDCELTKRGGVWICCTCEFGWQEDGPNRYQYCSAGHCTHAICEECKTWDKETAARMRADRDAELEKVKDEEQIDESHESDEEPTEEYSMAGEAEYYEEGVEGAVDYYADDEEGDETPEYSMYEPATDDDSD
jgi:hypothetical protein